jgi:hypothetical protein
MRRLMLIFPLVLGGLLPAEARIRAPSCDALVAFAFGARVAPVEVSFGKPPDEMTVDEFDQALDVVAVCLDDVEHGPADVPGLTLRERKRSKINALSSLAEDLKIYRSRARDRERRAVEKRD